MALETTALMIQLYEGGPWCHVRAHALVICGAHWSKKDGEWTEFHLRPNEVKKEQYEIAGIIPRLVPIAWKPEGQDA